MRFGFAVASFVLAFVSTSARGSDAVLKLGEKFEGAVISNIDFDVVEFAAIQGTKLTLTAKGEKQFRPVVRLFDADTGAEWNVAPNLTGAGTKTVKISNFVAPKTGNYAFGIGGLDGGTGKYTVTTSGKVASSLVSFAEQSFFATGQQLVVPLEMVAGAKVDLRVEPKKGSPAVAEIVNLLGPNGAVDLDPYRKEIGKAVLAKKVPAVIAGTYGFVIANVGPPGELRFTAEVSLPEGKATKKEPKEPTNPGGLSGTLAVPPLLAIPEIAGSNDTVATAQYCGSISPGATVRIQGAISSFNDFDAYRIEVGQAMKLSVMLLHDFVGDDFDLGVFSVAQNDYLSPTFETANEPESGIVNLPAAGVYLLVVWPFQGTGNYILTAAGSTGASAASELIAAPSEPRERPAAVSPARILELDADFVPGEFIVKLADADADRRAFAAANGMDVRIESPAGPFVVTMRGLPQDDASIRRATVLEKERVRGIPGVEYAELNHRHRIAAVPNDPMFPYQWHYQTMKLPQAWDVTKGSSNVIVAVLDTGIVAHPDLVSRDSGMGYDFISSAQNGGDGNGMDPNPTDPGDKSQQGGKSSWHGTHVAGTIGAATNNGVGVSGVDWFCRLMHVRVLGLQGGDTFDIAEAVRYTARLPNASGALPALRANVVNMSLGGGAPNQTMQNAVLAARAQGVTIIAAAGNDATSQPSYPASYTGVISVSSIDPVGNLASYSNYGQAIDVAAPGGETQVDYTNDGYGDGVLSTIVDEDQGVYAYDFSQGTSMACPHVAGAAALLLSVNPNLDPDQVESLLESTAIDLPPAGPDIFFGAGAVDAFAAVKAAAQTAAPQLSASTSLLDFGSVTTQLGFSIANTGNGTLTWSASDAETSGGNWLVLSANGGNATAANPSLLTATVNRTGLAAGNYTATVTITSNGGQALIQVMMAVASTPSQPQLSVSTNALDFGSTLNQLNFSVSNTGTGSLTFSVADAENPPINWLSLSTAGTTLGTGQSLQITANANRGILAPGAYAATINLTSNGGAASIQVSLNVPPSSSPTLSLSTLVLDFSTSASILTASLANTGGGTLSFTATDVELVGAGWLSVGPGNGVAPANLTVTVNRNGLAPGHYSGRIDVVSNGGTKSIAIEMDVSTVQATPIPLGTVYVVAVNPQSFQTAASAQVGQTGGNWQMSNVAIGGYFLFAGPDLDKDGFLCGPGEPCGGYPTLVDPTLAIVFPGLFTGAVNFSVSADTALPAGASTWFTVPERGFAILQP